MARSINLWSFIFSMLCVFLFFLSFSHPSLLNLTFYIAIVVFLVGMIGFFGIHNWKAAVRSILTVVLSITLIIIIGLILFVGHLFS
ncbi:hypothetical protein A4R27_25950 [Priestia endophytica]|nr:hypothetical protein A4R27_25950 [Priestia endophytica]